MKIFFMYFDHLGLLDAKLGKFWNIFVFHRSVEMHVSPFCFSERENRTYSHPRFHSECSSPPKNPLR